MKERTPEEDESLVSELCVGSGASSGEEEAVRAARQKRADG